MSNVLIRDVPAGDLDPIRAAASARGQSLQSYLREALRAQAAYLRRQEALKRIGERVNGTPPVPESERQAVLDDIGAEHASRADVTLGHER